MDGNHILFHKLIFYLWKHIQIPVPIAGNIAQLVGGLSNIHKTLGSSSSGEKGGTNLTHAMTWTASGALKKPDSKDNLILLQDIFVGKAKL